MITYYDFTDFLSVEEAIHLYEDSKLAIIINDGKDIMLESEWVEPDILYYK